MQNQPASWSNRGVSRRVAIWSEPLRRFLASPGEQVACASMTSRAAGRSRFVSISTATCTPRHTSGPACRRSGRSLSGQCPGEVGSWAPRPRLRAGGAPSGSEAESSAAQALKKSSCLLVVTASLFAVRVRHRAKRASRAGVCSFNAGGLAVVHRGEIELLPSSVSHSA